MNKTIENEIRQLFETRFNEKVLQFSLLPPSGSYREYCRLVSGNRSVIGAYNADVRENEAFLSFTGHFFRSGLPVPEIFSVSIDRQKYLISDFGDTTLFDFLTSIRNREGFSEQIKTEYKKVLQYLPEIQVVAGKGIDYTKCYPREAFDKQSMMWDLNYFKYYFLKLARIPFDEQLLEDDFQKFTNYLLSADSDFFLYRDFQSRNVMLKEGGVHFIDYQGGRKGALQYDLASLLYDGKANIPPLVREELFDYYIDELKKYLPVKTGEFKAFFIGFVLIRIMQAMGAYGFRGFYEKKEHFLKSIPFALDNLTYLLEKIDLPVHLPELLKVLTLVSRSEFLRELGREKDLLTVRITSFSYRKGIPDDPSGNGGGFVFDCRAINNPGRFPEFKELTGLDQPVVDFLENQPEMAGFMKNVKSLAKQSVKNYLDRKFTHLCFSFGCTGGQHRSVYAAENLARYVRNKFPVNVVLVHREMKK